MTFYHKLVLREGMLAAAASLTPYFAIITQQTHQRWFNVETTLIINVHQRCFNVDIWLKMKVEPTYIYRRCFNVGKTTLKQRWWHYVDSTSMNQCCFNVKIWLKMKVEPMYVYQSCFNIEKTTLKQYWQNYVHSTSILLFQRS